MNETTERRTASTAVSAQLFFYVTTNFSQWVHMHDSPTSHGNVISGYKAFIFISVMTFW